MNEITWFSAFISSFYHSLYMRHSIYVIHPGPRVSVIVPIVSEAYSPSMSMPSFAHVVFHWEYLGYFYFRTLKD